MNVKTLLFSGLCSAMFPKGGQTRKHCFLEMFRKKTLFPGKGGQTRKHSFLAMFFMQWKTNEETLFRSHVFQRYTQTRKHCFLAMFPEGEQIRKHSFVAMFPEGE